jgi:aryl-alcohol dehydrogenase-like predicted oxidoreductase
MLESNIIQSKIALGTAQFGLDYGISNTDGQVHPREVENILSVAKNNNIDILDTASGYGNSEKILGDVGIYGFKIVTKTTPIKSGVDNVLKSFKQSLENLRIKSVDGLLIHNIEDVQNKEFDILYEELNNLKQDKLINKIGFSVYTPKQVDFLLDNFDFDLIQVPFNVFDVRLIEGGQLQALKNKSVEVHARSVFLQGILLDFNNLPNNFLTWQKQFDKYQAMVGSSGLSLLEYALNFTLSIKELDKVLVGVNNADQLVEIINASKKNVDLKAFSINDVELLNPSLWS